MNLLAITHHNGIRIAELGALIGAIGAAIFALTVFAPSGAKPVKFIGAAAVAAAFALLVIATHWGKFG